mmetsp:Transcript_1453/g.3576  ORF Transcript_1453/g.3576 Transcript_1453/m.3576 type:complete len:177 (+) Transcript_1453:701-1231(+)
MLETHQFNRGHNKTSSLSFSSSTTRNDSGNVETQQSVGPINWFHTKPAPAPPTTLDVLDHDRRSFLYYNAFFLATMRHCAIESFDDGDSNTSQRRRCAPRTRAVPTPQMSASSRMPRVGFVSHSHGASPTSSTSDQNRTNDYDSFLQCCCGGKNRNPYSQPSMINNQCSNQYKRKG